MAPSSDGGEPDSLAPVIPIFGGGVPEATARASRRFGDAPVTWNAPWGAEADTEDAGAADGADQTGDNNPHGADRQRIPGSRSGAAVIGTAEDGDAIDAEAEREIAEKTLLRKLRTRSLSVREARAAVMERRLTPADADDLIDAFLRRGYLDDKALAEQLVHSAVDRKGQGRQVIGQTLAKRGIPRDVADTVIAELPDDDAERALDFARGKARSMGGLDHDTALRRLAGQLARRGYGGSTAFTAARTALDEVTQPPGPGVRFRDS